MIIILKKIFLFLSSYVPLYILLVGKEIIKRFEVWINLENKKIIWFNSFGDWMITIFTIISIGLSIFLIVLIKRSTQSGKEPYIIVEVENETDKHFFNYLAVYFLPCIGLSISSISDVFVLMSIMLIIGIIYVSNDLIYINPMLILGKYKVFSAKVKHIDNNDGKIIKKIIISNHPNIDKINGQLIQLVKSSSKYTIYDYKYEREEGEVE